MKHRLILVISAVVITSALIFFRNRQPVAETLGQALEEAQRTPPIEKGPSAVSKPPLATKDEILAEISALGANSPIGKRLALTEKLVALGVGAEPLLTEAMRDATTPIAIGILADALARIGTSEAVDGLLGVLTSTSDPTKRASILQALDALPPGQSVETLASTLAMQLEPEVRDKVIATVARAADPSTVHFLNEMYHEPETFIGQSDGIIAAIGAIHNSNATASLADLLRSSGEVPVMKATSTSLGKIGTAESLQSIADSLAFIGNTNPALREHMLSVIQSVTNTEAGSWLQKAAGSVSDPDLAHAAAYAIEEMKKSVP